VVAKAAVFLQKNCRKTAEKLQKNCRKTAVFDTNGA